MFEFRLVCPKDLFWGNFYSFFYTADIIKYVSYCSIRLVLMTCRWYIVHMLPLINPKLELMRTLSMQHNLILSSNKYG